MEFLGMYLKSAESQKLQPESSFTGRDQQCCYFMVNKQGLSCFSFAMVNSGKEKLSHLSPNLLMLITI